MESPLNKWKDRQNQTEGRRRFLGVNERGVRLNDGGGGGGWGPNSQAA